VKYFLLILALTLPGCASLTKPTNELRVTSYNGTVEPAAIGAPVDGQVAVDGCRVVSEGDIQGCLTVDKPGCQYRSAGCLDPYVNGSIQ